MKSVIKHPANPLVIMSIMVLAFIFSCSSGDGEGDGNSSSSIGIGSSSPSGILQVDCFIGGQCVQNMFTAAECIAATGVVGCSTSGVQVDCFIGGQCVQNMFTITECIAATGIVGCSNPTLGSSSSVIVLSSSSAATGSSSSSSARSSSSAPATSSSSNPSSSSSAPYTGQLYCDYGKPFTNEPAGCDPVETDSDCDLDYGKLVAGLTECGKRTDITYCDWGVPYYDVLEGWQGGCWRIDNTTAKKSECTNDWGEVVSQCPSNTLVRPSSSSPSTPSSSSHPSSSSTTTSGTRYCFDGDRYLANGCFIIGIISNIYYYLNADQCTEDRGRVVERAWCVTNGYSIYENPQ